jgi:hypothetical protein
MMSLFTKIVCVAATLAISMPVMAQHSAHKSPVDLRILGVRDQNGKPLQYPVEDQPAIVDLGLYAIKTAKFLTPQDLVIAHEKLFHLYGYDLGLTNYVHEHPTPLQQNPAVWRVTVTFKRAGVFRFWSDIVALPGSIGQTLLERSQSQSQVRYGSWNNGWDFTARPYRAQIRLGPALAIPFRASEPINVKSTALIKVVGPSQPNRPPHHLDPKFTGTDAISGISLKGAERIKAGQQVMMGLEFFRTDGTKPVITPYLGALAHVVVTNLKGDQVMHVHPMQHGGHLMLHAEFPLPGDYRLFVQFIDGGILRTIELAVRAIP